MDSFERLSWGTYKRKIKKFLKNTKDDIFLIACQSVVVGYLVIGVVCKLEKIIPDEKKYIVFGNISGMHNANDRYCDVESFEFVCRPNKKI